MPLFGKKRPASSNIGCGFILAQSALICLLLVINGFIVKSTINLDWGEEVRISQAINLIVPVIMIFFELWLFDVIFAATTRHKT